MSECTAQSVLLVPAVLFPTASSSSPSSCSFPSESEDSGSLPVRSCARCCSREDPVSVRCGGSWIGEVVAAAILSHILLIGLEDNTGELGGEAFIIGGSRWSEAETSRAWSTRVGWLVGWGMNIWLYFLLFYWRYLEFLIHFSKDI